MAHLENAGRPGPKSARHLGLNRVRSVRRLPSGRWLAASITVAGLLLWEWMARSGRVSALFFPAPSVILITLARSLTVGDLLLHLGATLRRLIIGFALGGIPGLLLGLSMGWSRLLREVLDPIVAAVHPVPKISILPLIMIIFGIGETSKIVAVAIGAFFPMVINCTAGVLQISPTYFDVAQNYGAGPGQVFQRVVLPGSLPLVLTGVRLALNVSLLMTIAVELVAAREGLGAAIWLAWETLRTEQLYAALALISLLGIGLNLLLQRFRAMLIPWYEELQAANGR